MGDVWYRGLTFVYDVSGEYELAKRKVKLIEKIVRNYEDAVSGFCIPKIGCVILKGDEMIGCHIVGDWRTSEIPGDIEDKSICREIWREEIGESLLNVGHNVHWEILARNIEDIEFKAFPPRRYMQKWGVKYDKKFPFPEGQKEGNLVVIWSGEDPRNRKFYISLDFGTFEDYIYTEDEKLARAVEEFLVDLMRDIVKATEPEYAYFDENEYVPLEKDPVCGDMEGLMGRTRYPDMDVIYVLESHLLAIKKSYLEKWIGKEGIEEIKSGQNVCSDGKVKIEDLGKWYMMYCEGVSHLYYFHYEDRMRTKEDEKVLELMRECRREKGVGIYGICGDNKRGYTLKVSSLKRYSDEEIEEFIRDMARKKGLKINKVIIYH